MNCMNPEDWEVCGILRLTLKRIYMEVVRLTGLWIR
jgi:hypothetical protein